jgi:rod shape determining protein RodA
VIAVGSGGFLGRGLGQGTQGPLGFLPERHTDFVFAVVCEDFGLLGGLLVLGLYGQLIASLLEIVRTTRDPEGRLIVIGVAAITLVQVVINVGMVLGVMPVTGLPLPLVSYGGSSLVATLCGFGLCASVARNRTKVFVPGGADQGVMPALRLAGAAR